MTDISHDIVESHPGYQNCSTSQRMLFGGVCHGEIIFVYLSLYLDQYCSKSTFILG